MLPGLIACGVIAMVRAVVAVKGVAVSVLTAGIGAAVEVRIGVVVGGAISPALTSGIGIAVHSEWFGLTHFIGALYSKKAFIQFFGLFPSLYSFLSFIKRSVKRLRETHEKNT